MEITHLRAYFIHLKSAQIFREFNVQADCHSKEALHISVGFLDYMEFIEGACIWHGSAQLFWAWLFHFYVTVFFWISYLMIEWQVLLWYYFPAECLLRFIDLSGFECWYWADLGGRLEDLTSLLTSHVLRMMVHWTCWFFMLVLLMLIPYVFFGRTEFKIGMDVLKKLLTEMYYLLMNKGFLWFIWISRKC